DLYGKINTNKVLFLETLDNILDLATFIPVCIAEYGSDGFASLELNTLIMDKLNGILSDYGFHLIKQ
ncbi:MAG: hypothetical protein LUI60_07560, partial [Clostridia bacterium]|nr:hypothetical protein [Clostridia bacterium]